ncbi:MAG: outer membrane beta-barrel protein [Devosia sp.]|nr:outer membrane beta-barrel protein [Devosia sp.]
MTRFALSFIAASLLTGTAFAADLQVYEPVDMSDPVAAGNFYASIFGGVSMINDFDFVSSVNDTPGSMRFDTGYSIDGSLGYDFGNGLSIEGQVGYLNGDASGVTYDGVDADVDGSASITYAMVNGWYGFDLGGISPFIGGGVGVASLAVVAFFPALPTASIDDSAVTWAAQVGAGVSFALTEDISLTGRYRYLTTGEVSLTDVDLDENTGSASASILDIGLKVAF